MRAKPTVDRPAFSLRALKSRSKATHKKTRWLRLTKAGLAQLDMLQHDTYYDLTQKCLCECRAMGLTVSHYYPPNRA